MVKFIFSIILICSAFTAFSKIKEKNIIGKWKISKISEDGNIWELNRYIENKTERDWGAFVEFKGDYRYQQNASAPCGLDDDRYHFYGKWELQNDKIILQMDLKNSGRRPNIYDNYTLLESGEMKIVYIKKNKIKLQITKDWEKRMSKK